MSDDLTVRLRKLGVMYRENFPDEPRQEFDEAADELDRLTGEVKRLTLQLGGYAAGATDDMNQIVQMGMAHEEFQAKADALADDMEKVKQWAEAYPEDVFPEPDLKLADRVLKDAGISMTGMNGTFARHLMKGVGEIAKAALTAYQDTEK